MAKKNGKYSKSIPTPDIALQAVKHLYPGRSKFAASQRRKLVSYMLKHGGGMDAFRLMQGATVLKFDLRARDIRKAVEKILTLRASFAMYTLRRFPVRKSLTHERKALLDKAMRRVPIGNWLFSLEANDLNHFDKPFLESEWQQLVEGVALSRNPSFAIRLINLTRSSACLKQFERSVEIARMMDFVQRHGGNTDAIKPPISSGGFT